MSKVPSPDIHSRLQSLPKRGLQQETGCYIDKAAVPHPLVRRQLAGGLPKANFEVHSVGEIEANWRRATNNLTALSLVNNAEGHRVIHEGDTRHGEGEGLDRLPKPVITPGNQCGPAWPAITHRQAQFVPSSISLLAPGSLGGTRPLASTRENPVPLGINSCVKAESAWLVGAAKRNSVFARLSSGPSAVRTPSHSSGIKRVACRPLFLVHLKTTLGRPQRRNDVKADSMFRQREEPT